ncbi:uncharacterized protein TNIN_301901 [Trichonephila inaurata madagascariensis]|uniref:Uncharacterized protein n=1 Tax=Trichonephila inaurata madagascariensis TaxID=2747483 RepID=A0A8X7CPL1_9ARAC|nr:uncharacterized protein TNIN_301901 [Trichonephila inaurata madagascariensis]
MQKFSAHQSERKLRHNESLVDYIYSKDALLEKAPFTILQPDRISMIIEIQALCDPCADITFIQQSCVPNDIVIHPWTDGQFQVVDHEIKPIGWISLNIIVASNPSINCVAFHQPSQPSLDDVTLPEATPNAVSSETKLIPKSTGLSTIQQAQLDAVILKFTDVFYSNDDNIGLCPYVELKIELQHERPIICRPYRLSEPDHHF